MSKRNIPLGNYKVKIAQYGDGLITDVLMDNQIHKDLESVFKSFSDSIVRDISYSNDIELDEYSLNQLEYAIWEKNGKPDGQFMFEFDIKVTAKKINDIMLCQN